MKKAVLAIFAMTLCSSAWAAPGDWVSYGYDQGGIRYSPLKQITTANVTGLKPAWTFHMNPQPGLPPSAAAKFGSEMTPLAVNGVLYLATPYSRVVAVDGVTGKQIWAYQLPNDDQPAVRGVSYWPGDGRHGGEIIVGTAKGLLIALSAKTGEPVAGFGKDGVLDLKTPDVMRGYKNEYGMSAPASIYKNLIILTARVQENPPLGPSGDVRAVDAVTGKFVWTFHTVAQPGEPGHDTWEGDSWKNRSGNNVWNMNTVDTQRGIAYLAIGAPAVDKDGTDRHGANLYSDSVVAVNAATGKYLWHFQATHHDIWDYDMHTPPTLLTVKKDGKTIPAVAVMNKPGILFLLDRVTGKPIFPVTEEPVPASTLPGEQAWPTQPVSVTPQLTRSHFELNEVATVTPELNAYCKGLIEKLNVQPTTTRYTPLPTGHAIVNFPANEGGPEWAGGAFDPKNHLFVVNSNEYGYVMTQNKNANGGWTTKTQRFVDDRKEPKLLCQQPPWGDLTAVDTNTGQIAWRHNFGITETLPEGQQDTGRPNTGGPITTAGGLIFIGATDDRRFRAYDTKTGKELWTTTLDYAGHATPITYQGKNGKQYVAIVATGGTYLFSASGGDSVAVFALP